MKRMMALLLVTSLLCCSCVGTDTKKESSSSLSTSSSEVSSTPESSSAPSSSPTTSKSESSSSEDASSKEDKPEEMNKVSYELDNGQVICFSIPDSWVPDYSIIMNTKPDDAIVAEYPDGIKVGEIGPNVIATDKAELTEDYFSSEENLNGKLLGVTHVEENGQNYYLKQMETYPGGGTVKVWYPYTYYIWTGKGFAILSLYALEMNNTQTQELFTQIVESVTFE